ncbi:MAG: membrane protein [bacterium]|nr:MAG: membrane protein [bacterium]
MELTTGTGALIAFSFVQLTMISASIIGGRHPHPLEWLGMGLAMSGLYLLVRPGLSAPSPFGAVMMATAGTAWGFYSLIGRRSVDPLKETAGNFARASVLVIVFGFAGLAVSRFGAAFGLPERMLGFAVVHWSGPGLLLAILSGAVTSALGYVLWYAALRGLTATRAALVQTSVPVLAAVGGILILGEPATARLAVAGGMILGGILLTYAKKAS